MAHGVTLKMRLIQPRLTPIDDELYMVSTTTGEEYIDNRATRRRHAAQDRNGRAHLKGLRKTHGSREARRAHRKMAKASRRRNR